MSASVRPPRAARRRGARQRSTSIYRAARPVWRRNRRDGALAISGGLLATAAGPGRVSRESDPRGDPLKTRAGPFRRALLFRCCLLPRQKYPPPPVRLPDPRRWTRNRERAPLAAWEAAERWSGPAAASPPAGRRRIRSRQPPPGRPAPSAGPPPSPAPRQCSGARGRRTGPAPAPRGPSRRRDRFWRRCTGTGRSGGGRPRTAGSRGGDRSGDILVFVGLRRGLCPSGPPLRRNRRSAQRSEGRGASRRRLVPDGVVLANLFCGGAVRQSWRGGGRARAPCFCRRCVPGRRRREL
mmetsp:Transcript_5725/g.12084  ORF Transcript_5725/g.12084 Transcript_5725/m.12084 type:complete len:296 (-) Transcript_5725:163-1050(-)